MELPQVLDDGRVDNILELINSIGNNSPIIRFDFRRVKHISAPGMAILNCVSDCLIEHQKKVELINLNLPSSLNQHIKKIFTCETFKLLEMKQLKYEDENNLISGSVNSLDPIFMERVDHKFNMILSDEKLWCVRLILNELMQNALDHSTAERFFFYAGVDELDFMFGVCDMGVSIPAKLEQKYECQDDTEYLLKSLELGVGTRRVRKGGLGLNHMYAALNEQKGRLVIISRNAQIRKYFARRKTATGLLKHKLRGTWCMARIPIK